MFLDFLIYLGYLILLNYLKIFYLIKFKNYRNEKDYFVSSWIT